MGINHYRIKYESLKNKKMNPIDYTLKENLLTKGKPNDLRAQVVNQRTHAESDLAEAIAKRNIGVSKPEALAILEARAEILMEWIADGDAVNLRLEHYHASIPGAYEEDEHPKEAVLNITPSKELTAIMKTVPLRHVDAVNPIGIDFVHDVKTNTTNDKITRGGTVKIKGRNLKIAGEKPEVGGEFISREDPEAIYCIPPVDIITNNPAELVIIAPAMVAGEPVVLKVTTQFSGTTVLKTPRSITFDKALTVV
jgi:hypothetical protein